VRGSGFFPCLHPPAGGGVGRPDHIDTGWWRVVLGILGFGDRGIHPFGVVVISFTIDLNATDFILLH
jgi:hypothetical protein